MAAELTDRRATASAALGYADAAGVKVFQGTRGTAPWPPKPRRDSGFGYDPIVIARHLQRPPHLARR